MWLDLGLLFFSLSHVVFVSLFCIPASYKPYSIVYISHDSVQFKKYVSAHLFHISRDLCFILYIRGLLSIVISLLDFSLEGLAVQVCWG